MPAAGASQSAGPGIRRFDRRVYYQGGKRPTLPRRGHRARVLAGRRSRCVLTGRRSRCVLAGRRSRCVLAGRRSRCVMAGRRSRCALAGRRSHCVMAGRRSHCVLAGCRSPVSWPGAAPLCHGRPCAGHPRLCLHKLRKSWMAGPGPAMTPRAAPRRRLSEREPAMTQRDGPHRRLIEREPAMTQRDGSPPPGLC
jgi:hypothetical protein